MSKLLTVERLSRTGETIYFDMEECCNCGVPFLIPSYLRKRFLNDPSIYFYCPNGHSQHYSGPSEAQRLKKKLDEETATHQRELERINNRLLDEMNAKKKAERQLKRVHNGVCPCCNRSFVNLQRHMKTKHPETISKP